VLLDWLPPLVCRNQLSTPGICCCLRLLPAACHQVCFQCRVPLQHVLPFAVPCLPACPPMPACLQGSGVTSTIRSSIANINDYKNKPDLYM
jgi:hypothetical protein